MNKTKKIAIIGSGPISMFEALYQAKIGNKVIVYDKQNRIGGAWANVVYNNYNTELGCHIWDVDKETYLFLEKFLNQKLEPLKPSPTILYKNKSFPYDWKNNIIILQALKNDFKGYFSNKKLIKPVLINRKYKYPEKGGRVLVKKLLEQCQLSGVGFKLSTAIEGLKYSSNKWELGVSGKSESFDEVIITSLSSIKKIVCESKAIEPNYQQSTFTHFHFVVENNDDAKKISYIRVMGHPFIHRISDISAYSVTNDKKIYAVGIFRDKIQGDTEEQAQDKTINYLKSLRVLSANVKVVDVFSNDYPIDMFSKHQIDEINNLPNINLLRSTNLIYSIADNIERWEETLFT